MPRLRSLLPLILVLFATFLVSCSGRTTAQTPPTYTAEKIDQVKTYLKPVKQARERLPELESLVDEEKWTDVDSFIHGPLGSLRKDVTTLNRQLLAKDQRPAQGLAQELFIDLEDLDAAAEAQNKVAASSSYYEAVRDFNAYLDEIPRKPLEVEEAA